MSGRLPRRGEGFRGLSSGAHNPPSSGNDNAGENSASTPAPSNTPTTTAAESSQSAASSRTGMATSTATRTGTGAPPRGGARPVTGRLQSLKRRPPTGNPVPVNPDGSAPKPTLKYKPRAVQRRSKEEREKLEMEEAQRNKERLAEAAAIRRATEGVRGRGGGGRGRGRGRGGRDAGGRGGFQNRKIKMEYGGTGRRSGTQSKAVSEASSEDESGMPRFSVEQINDVSESEDEDEGKIKGKTPERSIRSASKGMRPERLPREEHVERAVGVNTEAAASRAAQARKEAERKAAEEEEDESLFFRSEDDEEDYESEDEVEVTETRHLENKPEAQDETGAKVKQEPDTDLALSDIPPAGQEPAPTAVEKKKKKKSKKKAKAKQLRSQFQTEEERREYERHTQEVDELRRLLGTMMTDDLRTEEKPAEGAEPNEEDKQKQLRREEVEEVQRERQQRLFLVQFPPMTPNLVDPAKRNAETAGGDVQETPAGHVKQENKDGDSPLPSQPASSNANPLISATQNRLPPGRAGKLQIHASGKATINWGGIQFELNRGSDVSFLQDAIVMPEQKPVSGSATPSIVGGNTSSREGPPEKSVWAMSQVKSKFVVSPDWEAML